MNISFLHVSDPETRQQWFHYSRYTDFWDRIYMAFLFLCAGEADVIWRGERNEEQNEAMLCPWTPGKDLPPGHECLQNQRLWTPTKTVWFILHHFFGGIAHLAMCMSYQQGSSKGCQWGLQRSGAIWLRTSNKMHWSSPRWKILVSFWFKIER